MKKMQRSDAGIDYIKMFADHSRKAAVAEYSEQTIKDFGDQVQQSILKGTQAAHRVRGLRAEALFNAVIAALGEVALIKAEDTGDVYYTGDDVQVPDFRIVGGDGAQILVEVKAQSDTAFPPAQLALSNSSIDRLRRYAELTRAELRIAIFWERMSQWTLNRLEAFRPGVAGARKWRISFPRAFATDEMATLGDYTVAVGPPLRLRVLLDPEKSNQITLGRLGTFTDGVRGIKLLWRDQELEGLSAKIAWRLIAYGTWDEQEPVPHYEGDRLVWVDYPYEPAGWREFDPEGRGAAPIGALSQMISLAYLSGASETIHTSATEPVLEPGAMREFIPKDFMSLNLQLKIGVLRLSPNFDFEDDDG